MTAVQILARMFMIILVAEGATMILISEFFAPLYRYGEAKFWFWPMIDMALLAILAAPLTYFIVVLPFVRAREHAQHDLRLRNRRFMEAEEVAHIGSWDLNLITRELKWSREAYRIFGMDPAQDDLTPEVFDERVHPDDFDVVTETYKETLKKQLPYCFEHRIVRPDGQIRWVEERCHSEFMADGTPVRSLGTVQDITDRRASDIAKQEFVATVSHELRTPLTSIMGALKLILSGATGKVNERTEEMLGLALRNSNRLLTLISDLLELEKLEAGEMECEWEYVDLSRLVEEAVEVNAGFADGFGVSLKRTGENESVLVRGNKLRLIQVLTNLISNAVKFSHPGDHVEISLTVKDGKARISVADTGDGIPEHAQPTIFHKFTQADSSDSRKRGGTGLGLNISQAIVAQHGGEIDFLSKEGTGSVFFFELGIS